ASGERCPLSPLRRFGAGYGTGPGSYDPDYLTDGPWGLETSGQTRVIQMGTLSFHSAAASLQSVHLPQPDVGGNICCFFSTVEFAPHQVRCMIEWPIFARTSFWWPR